MAKKDNIIDFRDYQPGKRETIETHDLDAFRETLYDLGFLGPSSSDTLDETEEVEPKEAEETESVSASETVEEPTVEAEVEETTDPAAEEVISETDDESEGESMVEETEPDDEPEVVESEDDDSESDDEEEPEIIDEDDSDDDDFLSEDDEEELKEEPDKLKAPGESLKIPLSELIIKEAERGVKHFDPDEPLVEDDDSDEEVVSEADFKEVAPEPEEDSSEFEEEIPVSRRKRHKHSAPSGAGTRFFKKLGTSFADRLLSNFGLGETPAVQPSKATEEESKAEDSTDKAEFSSPLQKLLTEEIMSGNLSRLEEWIENKNVNKLTFLFSNNPILSDWVQENEMDVFLKLPDEVFNFVLKKDKESPEKKDDKDEKKS